MGDPNATDGTNGPRSGLLARSLARLLHVLPGVAPRTPKRNVLVALIYLLLAGLAIGLLDWLL